MTISTSTLRVLDQLTDPVTTALATAKAALADLRSDVDELNAAAGKLLLGKTDQAIATKNLEMLDLIASLGADAQKLVVLADMIADSTVDVENALTRAADLYEARAA